MITGRVVWRLALALQLLIAATVLAQTGSLDSDTSTLLALKSSLGNPASLSSWNSGQNPCTDAWTGVNCTNGRVSSLGLSSLGLKGSLFVGLSSLDALAALDLSSNALTSTLPPAWSFASLQNMTLASNKLTGSLPPAWSSGMPKLQQLHLEGNSLLGTMPASWVNGTGFAQPFTATLQPGNAALCGPVSPAGGYTLMYDDGSSGGQHTLTTTLGSCAQGTCGKAALNSSAPNLYDVSWANTAATLDVAATNTDIQLSSVPLPGTPVELPCYPSGPPTFFGSNVAYLKATWQSTTDGTQTSSLAVAAQGRPGTTDTCSTTTDSPGWWMVDLQQSTPVQAVLLYAGADMATVEVRVGDTRDPTANALCTSRGAKSREGFISVCDSIRTGRYVSVVATQSRLSLCRVEVYSLATNAALGKYTAASSGSAAAVTDGSAADNSCSSVVSRQDLSTWITVDLGYSASVSTVVIANGASTFNGDLTIRLGNTEVTQGDENAPCTQSLTMSSGYTLPVQCLGTGRYLTLWVQRAQASTMYICEIYVYLAAGPTSFGTTSPYIPPPSPPPSPYSPSPSGPIDASVDASTTVLDTILLLTGSGLNPLTPQTQQKIVTAMTDVWTPANGITDVTFVQYSSGSQASVAVELYVGTQQGQAPAAAQFMVQSANNGDLATALAKEGVSVSTAAVTSIAAYQASPSPSPSSPDSNNSSGGGSSTPIGAIVGGVVGGIAVVAAMLAFLLVRRRRRRQRAAASPKALAAMEQGRLGGQFGGKENGVGVDVAARTVGSKVLVPDPALVTEGPPEDVLNFLTADPPEAQAALFDAASQTGIGNGLLAEGEDSPTRGGGLTPAASESISVTSRLLSQNTLARMGSSVSELWLVDWSELQLQKQIGEGSFGKVHLAKWRETTVAVKVLSNAGLSDSMEEEFPEQGGGPGQGHPLYESLQKEAAMMAALRHPSIVMYLGVCLDPPAVVTEYCARGSLNDVLKRARSSPSLATQLDWPRRLNMALDAAKGMLYLHSCNPPIIHRDLKSPNLLVDKHWRVKVGDFNLSRVMEDSVVLSSVAATNPRWLAPEILAGKGYTYASDVYAFGIILWEFLTWQVPWHEYGPWQVVAMVTESSKRPEVPEVDELPTPAFAGLVDYLQLMQECWAQDPTQRPSFTTVISRLRKLLALEAQRQRQHSAAAESPSKHSTADGSETPQMRSRPIVSIYDLSGGAAGDLPAPMATAASLATGASGDVALTASLARSEGGLTGSLMTLDTEAGTRRLETIRGGSSDEGAAER